MNLLLFFRGCQLAWVFALVYFTASGHSSTFLSPGEGWWWSKLPPLHTRPRPSDLGIGKAGLWQQVSFRRSCCTAAGRVPEEASQGRQGSACRMDWGLPAKKRGDPRAGHQRSGLPWCIWVGLRRGYACSEKARVPLQSSHHSCSALHARKASLLHLIN